MLKYIDNIIVPYTKRRPCALLVDSYAPHLTPLVHQCALWYNIEIIMVPKGQTPTLQPLDISFNAEFKRNRQRECSIATQCGIDNLENKDEILKRAAKDYEQVTKNTILKGWKPIIF